MVLALINLIMRWGDPAGAVLMTGIILSAITALILTVTAWLGGELTYRFGIGVLLQPPQHEDRHRFAAAA